MGEVSPFIGKILDCAVAILLLWLLLVFYFCQSLTSVLISSTVPHLADSAFLQSRFVPPLSVMFLGLRVGDEDVPVRAGQAAAPYLISASHQVLSLCCVHHPLPDEAPLTQAS